MLIVLAALQIGSLAPPISFVVESKPVPIDSYKGNWIAVVGGVSEDVAKNLRILETEDKLVSVVVIGEQDREAREQLGFGTAPRLVLFNPNLRLVKIWDSELQGGFAASLKSWLTGRSLEPGETALDPRSFLIESGALDSSFARRADEKGLLILFLRSDGPVDALYTDRLKAIGDACKQAKIAVLGLFPAEDDTVEAVHSRAEQLGFPCVIDPGGAFADVCRATSTPEAFLLDAKSRIAYTGAIDSNTWESPDLRPYLLDAIVALAAGKPIRLSKTFPFGTAIRKAGVASSARFVP